MKLTIGNRITLAFGVGVLAIIVLSLSAYLGAKSLYSESIVVYQTREDFRLLRDFEMLHLKWLKQLSREMIDAASKNAGVEIDPHKCDFGKWYYSEKRSELEKHAPYLASYFASIEEPHTKLHESAGRINELLGKGDRAGASAHYLGETDPSSTKIGVILEEMQAEIIKNGKNVDVLEKSTLRQQTLMGVLGAIFTIGIIVIAFFFRRNIMSLLLGTINTLSTTSTEIASTVEQHERTATEQAASVSETTSTIDELGASSRQSTEQADAVAAMAKQALTTTEEGVKMARQASDGMANMKDKVESIGGQILHLSEQTGQIGKIATMVTDIAGQINMLALNAAVEAVRAGEQGKGFAVIAQEVRKLADQGKKSAEQANTIVADIQKATNSAVMVTEEGTKTVSEVAGIAQKAGEAFASLSGVATGVYENAQQVSLNSRQQAAAIKQVTDAMNSVSAGAKETAAGITQTKIGVQRLNEAAQGLKKMV